MHYYNENEPSAAAWLKQLITDGHLPYGDVDDRSIEDVKPSELDGYTQCHFFAGIGGWPLVLQLAGWPTDRPVWTGSCPCQPYSNAGAGAGNDDPRNLWWCYRWLIDQCRPPVVFGEQVASKAGREWLAGVQTDIQTMGYDTAGADLCAAGVGAPHIRQRLWWVGHAVSQGPQGHAGHGHNGHEPGRNDAPEAGSAAQASGDSGVADATQFRLERRRGANSRGLTKRSPKDWEVDRRYWDNCVFVSCADGKQRRIEPGTQPLVDGIPRGVVPECDPGAPGYAQNTGEARKMRLYGYGNAIVPQVGAEFVAAFMEANDEL